MDPLQRARHGQLVGFANVSPGKLNEPHNKSSSTHGSIARSLELFHCACRLLTWVGYSIPLAWRWAVKVLIMVWVQYDSFIIAKGLNSHQ